MTARDSGSNPANHPRCVAANTDRAIRALDDARTMAARLASTAQDLATTYDRLAETREACADQADAEQRETTRQSARRARDRAAQERRDAQELQEKWNLPRD
jgi:Skp family chaperone for outer membrane proteins